MVIAKGSESGDENKKAEGKKQELFVKVFRFCLPVPISSNYPSRTFCFLNKGYLHHSRMKLQQLVALGLTNPSSASAWQLNSLIAVVVTIHQVWFTIQLNFMHSIGTCKHTLVQTHTCHFKNNFPCLGQGSTHTPHPGHPAGWAQGQERAQRGSSALTGSYFQAGAFTSCPRATLWLCLCPSLQPLMRTLTPCLGFASNLPYHWGLPQKTSKHQKPDTKKCWVPGPTYWNMLFLLTK